MAKIVEAVAGEKKSPIPTWDGNPAGLRSWLRLLGFWEVECTMPKEKWGIKLHQALSGDARKVAESVDPAVLMSANGYAAILTALTTKFKPYLEVAGPLSIDAFFFTGERQQKEAFTNYVARKESQRQELEAQTGAALDPLVGGRILLRQANLSEYQQANLALKNTALLTYDEVVKVLLPLDRIETLTRSGALTGGNATRTYLQAGEDEGDDQEEGESEDGAEDDDDSIATDFLEFEDREYDEAEAIYVQAYNDVRKDLRSRRKERGFVKHDRKRDKSRGRSGGKGGGKGKRRSGRSASRSRDGKKSTKDSVIHGTEEELNARTRCFSCQELGHISRNCPHRSNPKKNFVAATGNPQPAGTSSTATRSFNGFVSVTGNSQQSGSFATATRTFAAFHHGQEVQEVRSIYAGGVKTHSYEAIVDTAAEECIIGSTAYTSLVDELAACGLRPVPVRGASAVPCAGIGGQATLQGVVDIPTCIGGLLGLVRFTIIEDSPNFVTPPLLGVSYLDSVGASIDLVHNLYSTEDGYTAPLRRLPSGHRAVNMVAFSLEPWKLPKQYHVQGHDPFRLPASRSSHSFLGGSGAGGGDFAASSFSYVSLDDDAGEPMDNTFFETYVESTLVEGNMAQPDVYVEATSPSRRSRSRSRSRASDASEQPTIAYDDFPEEPFPELPSEEASLHLRPEQEPSSGSGIARRADGSAINAGDRRQEPVRPTSSTAEMEEIEEEMDPGRPMEPDDPDDGPRDPPVLPIARPNPYEEETEDSYDDGSDYTYMSRVTEDSREDDPSPRRPRYYRDSLNRQYELDPTKEVHIFIQYRDGHREQIERKAGWIFDLLTPLHLRRQPQVALSDRRNIQLNFPNGHSRSVIDNWRTADQTRTTRPWYGRVTFFELGAMNFRPIQNKGKNKDKGGGRGPPGPGRGPHGRGPRPPGYPPPDRGQASKGEGKTAYTSTSSVGVPSRRSELGAKQPLQFDLADEPWEPTNVACTTDPFFYKGELKSGELKSAPNVFGSVSEKPFSALRSCARRHGVSDRRSPLHKLMNWTLSNAAQSFLAKLRRHGAQEQVQGEQQRIFTASIGDGDEPAGVRGRPTQEDGIKEVPIGMDPNRHSAPIPGGDDSPSDGPGLHAEEGCRRGREGCSAEGEGEELLQQEQGEEGRAHPTGHWQPTSKERCPEALGSRTNDVLSSCGISSLQEQPVSTVVDMPEVRKPLGTSPRSGKRVHFFGGCGSAGVSTPEDSCGHLPEVPASSEIQAGSGQHRVGSESPWTSTTSTWRHWCNFDPTINVETEVHIEGSQDVGTTSYATYKAGASLPPDGPGDPGARGGLSAGRCGSGEQPFGDRRSGESQCPTSGQRVLIDKKQLGGKHGKKLNQLLTGHFSKFMVFLCMNCLLPQTTMTAFGSPDAVAWRYEDDAEFSFVNDLPPEEPQPGGRDFVACYVYGRLAQHFASAIPDNFGVEKPLAKDDKKFVMTSMKTMPKIMEIYSPPRMTPKASKHGFSSGGALDLTTGWDFNRQDHQRAALRMVRDLQPAFVLLCPPCTTFSQLRQLSNFKRDASDVAREEEEGMRHLRFAVLIAKIQHRNGRGFLFEHPKSAKSWHTKPLQDLEQQDGVYKVAVDLCRFGLRTSKGDPALKPTLLLTNVEALATTLNRRCNGFHSHHGPLLAGEAGKAAKYTPAFVEAILRGLRQHVQQWIKSRQPTMDYWEVQQNDKVLVRHHRTPRRALFVPTGLGGCPIPPGQLSSQRTTRMIFDVKSKQEITDNWRASPQPREAQPRSWTGSTSFTVQDAIVLPTDWRAVASFVTAAAAHPIFAYITEESEFQMDWKMAFPAHSILGGADCSSPSSSRFDRFSGPDDAEDLDVHMLEDAAIQNIDDDETSDQRVQQALSQPHARQRPVDNLVHPEIRREIFKIHRNLGHPSLQVFVRALKHAGTKPEILKWVKNHFKCDICERKQMPSSHRPSKLQKAMNFNEVVGIDLLQVNVPNIGEYLVLNCLCWGTNLQIAEVIPDKQANTVAEAFTRAWIAHYGPPALIVCDQGREFLGHPFTDKMSHMGIPIHFINARAPHENGRTERAGGILKSRLLSTLHEVEAMDDMEVRTAIAEVTSAHNRSYNRSGFTPYQRAFGTLPRLPGSLLSDDTIDKQLILESAGDSMKRSWQIREAAAKAWLRWQDDESVHRAISTRTRTSDTKTFEQGDLVYVWRNIPGYKGWSGPGTIIAIKGDSAWVSMKGYLMKAARGQVRHGTAEESLGAELALQMSSRLLEDIEKGAIKLFRDTTAEGDPEEVESDGYSPSIGPSPEPAEPLDGGDSLPMEAEPSLALPPIPEEAPHFPQPMEDVEQDLQPDQMAMDVSDRSTAEPSASPLPSAPSSRRESVQLDGSRRPSIRVDEGRGGSMQFGPIRDGPPIATAMPYPSPPAGVPSWPSPPRSNFFEVSAEPAEVSPHWTMDRPTGKYTMRPASDDKFNLTQAEGVYNQRDQCIYLTKAKTSPGQVEFRFLEKKYKEIFRKSRAKEVKSLLDSGAIKIMSLEESLRFAKNNPNHVLTSRYVDRWKPTDAFGVIPEQYGTPGFEPENHGGLAAKSRWCVVGWKDPHVHEIERTAPTPLTASIYLGLQLAASRRWVTFSKDAKTAFLQSRATTRRQPLACRMPSDEAFEGYDHRQLILLLTEVYGLVSGPAWWRRSLLEILVKELGYRVCVYDRCVLTLDGPIDPKNPDAKVPTKGLMILEVDDILEAGDNDHRKLMATLEKRLRFGKVVNLQEVEGGSGYAGRRLRQMKDFSFIYSMDDYVTNRLQEVKTTRKVLKKDAANVKLNANEIQQLRGVVASINWAAREGRPDGSAAASILSGVFPEPTFQDLLMANQVVAQLKEKKVSIKIHHIPEKDIRHLLIADSSFDPSGKTKPQHGWIQGITTPALNAGKFAPVSLIAWRSKKLRRKAGNTTLCESISLSTALASAEKQVATLKSFQYSRFDPKQIAEELGVEVERGLRGPPTVIASENPTFVDPETVAVIDAKSVFDSTSSAEKQFQGEDDRAALESAIIQESLAKLKARLRWLPHNYNPADGLTKLPNLAHMLPMHNLLKDAGMKIQEEKLELASGRQGDHRMKVHGST